MMLHPSRVVEHQSASSCRAGLCVVVRRVHGLWNMPSVRFVLCCLTDTLQKVDPQREEPLLGRNAHSARYGELVHDRTVKPVSVHHQEQAYSENFVMGSDAAEFVNKVKDQVRNRQKRMSNVAESCDEHSIIW